MIYFNRIDSSQEGGGFFGVIQNKMDKNWKQKKQKRVIVKYLWLWNGILNLFDYFYVLKFFLYLVV